MAFRLFNEVATGGPRKVIVNTDHIIRIQFNPDQTKTTARSTLYLTEDGILQVADNFEEIQTIQELNLEWSTEYDLTPIEIAS